MRAHYTVQFPHRKGYYRTLEAATLKAFTFLRACMKEGRKECLRELHVVNKNSGLTACRLLTTEKEVCIHYV